MNGRLLTLPAVVQCPGSQCQVSALPEQRQAVCPSCEQTVQLGGTPSVPRFAIHNEPALA